MITLKNVNLSSPFIFMIIFILLVSNLYANKINDWGIKFGLSISNQHFDYKSIDLEREFENFYGLNIDLFYTVIHYKQIKLMGQITYSQKGCVETLVGTYIDTTTSPYSYRDGDEREFKNSIDYISFSLPVKFNLEMQKICPYIFLGPRLDIPIKTKAVSIPNLIYDNILNSWGLSIGVGNEFYLLKSMKILMELQYSPDITQIYNKENPSIKKISYEIKIGVVF